MTDPDVLTTPVDLRADGVLWMINRSLFHPLGFALAYSPDSGEFTLWGNGDEPWRFSESMEESENEAFVSFRSLLDRVTKEEAK